MATEVEEGAAGTIRIRVFDEDGSQVAMRGDDLDPVGALGRAESVDGFVWVDCVNPAASDLAGIAEVLRLHPVAVEAAATGFQQPKVQDFGDHVLFVFWSLAEAEESEAETLKLFLFVGEHYVVTVHHGGSAYSLPEGRSLYSQAGFLRHGAIGALYLMLATVVRHYEEVVNAIEDELTALERAVFDETVLDDSSRIYRLRKRIGRVERPLSSMVASIERNTTLSDRFSRQPELDPYLEDVLGDLISAGEAARDQGRSIDNVVSSHESNVSLQQNDDTRKISAIGALLAVPTVVAGLYGMNFTNLPGVGWGPGWILVCAVIAAVDLGLYVNFKRRSWL